MTGTQGYLTGREVLGVPETLLSEEGDVTRVVSDTTTGTGNRKSTPTLWRGPQLHGRLGVTWDRVKEDHGETPPSGPG